MLDPFRKLRPRTMSTTTIPVMFIVESAATRHQFDWLAASRQADRGWVSSFRSRTRLWLTVLPANFAEAMAEGRGKAQADALQRPDQTVANLGAVADLGRRG